MNIARNLLITMSVLVSLAFIGLLVAQPSTVFAVDDPKADLCNLNDEKDANGVKVVDYEIDAKTGDCVDVAGGETDVSSIFKTITNTLLFLVGAIAVIMLIIGGLRYVVSGGDANAVTAAKNTILYAIVGIVVAFLAFAAVNFVTNRL